MHCRPCAIDRLNRAPVSPSGMRKWHIDTYRWYISCFLLDGWQWPVTFLSVTLCSLIFVLILCLGDLCLLFGCAASCSASRTCFVPICLFQYTPLEKKGGAQVEKISWFDSHISNAKNMSLWMTFNFLQTVKRRDIQKVKNRALLEKRVPENSQCNPANNSRRQKTDFHGKIKLAKLHIAGINQPQHTCPVWIISQLSLQRLPCPCFLCSESWSASN